MKRLALRIHDKSSRQTPSLSSAGLTTPALAYAFAPWALDLGITLIPTIVGESSRSVREAQPTPSLVAVAQFEASLPSTGQIEVPGCATCTVDSGCSASGLCLFQRVQFPGMLVNQLSCDDPEHLVDSLAVF